MFVCVCSAVSDAQIENAIDEGITSFEEMQDKLGVANACGSCACEVKEILHNKMQSSLAGRVATNPHASLARQIYL